MEKLLQAIRAKSKESGVNPSLINHIKETLRRAVKLLEFIERNKSSFAYKQFTEDNKRKEFFKNLFKALFLHDLGKINYKFQKKVYSTKKENELWNEIETFFEPKNDGGGEIDYTKIDLPDHEVVSLLYTLFFLDDSDWDKKIRTAILLHHYNSFYTQNTSNVRSIFSMYPDLEKYLKFLIKKYNKIKKFLKSLIEELIKYFKNDEIKKVLEEFKGKLDSQERKEKFEKLDKAIKRGYGISKILSLYKIPGELNREWYDFFVFLGALRRCDYSASGDVEIEISIDLSKECYDSLSTRIKRLLGKKENEKIWQEKVLEEKDFDNLILIAPTGSGKTEFSLLWAAKRGKKLIYTLPLRVALNDLFWRFKVKKENKEPYFNPDFIKILHSTSFIEYLKGEKEGSDIDVGTKMTGAKILSSPLLLTTPDQIFLSSLKYYGFDKLLNVYPLSAIVVDEIQAYNPEMAAIIIKTLEMIKELNGNVLIITATFPPYFREFLKYEQIDLKKLVEQNKISKDEIKNYSIKRHKIKLIKNNLFEYEKKELKITDFNATLEEGLSLKEILENKNKNILVIVNNVNKAIKLFENLEKEYKERVYLNGNPLLLHSRIIENEKSKRISAIKDALKNKRKGMILVSTQIVEASVDIDFDILVTEISPIDSQIQRWGRIYRNRIEEGDYNEDEPNIYIFVGKENEGNKVDRGTKAIYDEKVIIKTIEILGSIEGQLLDYKNEKNLVDLVFKDELLKEYVDKIKKTFEWLKFHSAEKRSEAQRIFRDIAGVQVFIPELPNENDEIYKALCKILKENKSNWELPLETSDENKDSISRKIKEKIGKKIDKWKILEVLYKYSFNLPIFGFENSKIKYTGLEKRNFKGFFVLKEADTKKLAAIKKFGVKSIKDVVLDDLEIEEHERRTL